jgi:hypothetical protein
VVPLACFLSWWVELALRCPWAPGCARGRRSLPFLYPHGGASNAFHLCPFLPVHELYTSNTAPNLLFLVRFNSGIFFPAEK